MSEKPRWSLFDTALVYGASFFFTTLLAHWSQTAWRQLMAARGLVSSPIQEFLLAYLMQFLVFVGLILLIACWLRQARLNELGIRGASLDSWFRYGLLGGFLLYVFAWSAGYLLEKLHPNLPQQGVETVLRGIHTIPEFLILLLVAGLLAPLAEELFYRGMLYPILRSHLGKNWGMITAGALFGLAHWDLWRALPLAVGGILLCYLYEKSGSILVCTLAHGVWNTLLAVLIFWSSGLTG